MLYRPGVQHTNVRSSALPIAGSAEHIDQIFKSPGPLPFPTEAKLDATGEPITLLQTCDWEGHSPANVCVDQRGKQFIATFDELTVTDHRIVPNPAVDAIRTGRMGT